MTHAAAGALGYERRRLWRSIGPDNAFAGKPRPEHDAAWNALIERKVPSPALLDVG